MSPANGNGNGNGNGKGKGSSAGRSVSKGKTPSKVSGVKGAGGPMQRVAAKRMPSVAGKKRSR